MGEANGAAECHRAAGWGFVVPGVNIHVLVSSPRLPHAWLLHHDGMGSDGTGAIDARVKLVLVDLQGKLFK